MAQEPSFNLLYLIAIVRKYFWYMAVVVGLAAVLAIVLTMPAFYPPEYMSRTVIYPTNAERFDGLGLFAEEPTIFLYGDSKGVERLDNIAESEEVMLTVLDSLNLWKEYGVDKEKDESPKFYAARVYRSRVSAVKIGGNGLELTAYDTDPQRAADIVNLIAWKIDEINKRMIEENKRPILELYERSLKESFRQVEMYADSSSKVRKEYYIFDDQAQTEVLIGQVLKAESNLAAARTRWEAMKKQYGAESEQARKAKVDVDMMQSKAYALISRGSGTRVNLEKFQEGLDRVAAISDVSLRLARDIKDLQSKIEYLRMMDQSDYSTVLFLEKAQPSDRKARPVRWIILAATVLLTAVVCLIGAVLIDFLTREKVIVETESN